MIAKLWKNKKLISSIVVTILFLFVVYSSLPFISAFFGALILAFIFSPLDNWMREKMHFSKQLSAFVIIIISLILIILPLFFLAQGLIEQVRVLPEQITTIKEFGENISKIVPLNIKIDKAFMNEHVIPILTQSIRPFFSNVFQMFVILFLLFFLLYYFIIYSKQLREGIYELIPFNEKHKERTIEKFKSITYSTVLGTFLIALIQGGLLALNFYLLGISNALFWGFVGVILSFLPIIGLPVIWIPVSAFFIIQGDIHRGIALIIIGIMLSSIDNILRPIINEKYGKIHPLISIIGIYIGILQFGIIGIFIGPLVVAYLVLFWQMYKEEYIQKKN